MKKTLEQRLAKKTQDVIKDVKCPECGEKVHYILRGRGSSGGVWYEKVKTEQIELINQDGQEHKGYKRHECRQKKR